MHFWHTTDGPLLYAHRGAGGVSENTLPAFERALELGADVLELDVHPTRDGVFVVSHDATGARMAGVARALSESSWAEVSDWDAGAGFVDQRGARPFAGTGVRFARFDEVLARFQDVAVNVDVKDARPRDLERLLSIVREAKAESRVLLTSFSYRVLSRLRALGYSGAIGLSQLDVVRLVFSPAPIDRLFPYGGVRAQIPTRSGPIDLTAPRLSAKCKRLAIGVDYWVVNEPAVAQALLEHGADGIITDDPRAIAEVFRTSPRTAAWRSRHARLAR